MGPCHSSGNRAVAGILPVEGGSGAAALEPKSSGAAAALDNVFEVVERVDGDRVAAPYFGSKAASGILPVKGGSGAAALEHKSSGGGISLGCYCLLEGLGWWM